MARKIYPALHGLRGVAVLYVLISHLGLNGLSLIPFPHDGVGKVGVWIFFTLSGFLLTKNFSQDIEVGRSFEKSLYQYALNRIFRIYPLFVCVLIVHLLIGDMNFSTLLNHLSLQAGQDELWAISVEFQYYLVIPLIAYAAMRLRFHIFFLLLLLVIYLAIFYGNLFPEKVFSTSLSLLAKATPFLLGSLLAISTSTRFKADVERPVDQYLFAIPLTVLAFLTVSYRALMRESQLDFIDPWLSLALGLTVCWIIYLTMRPGPLNVILQWQPLVFLGEISFSVYLIHLFVIRLMLTYSSNPNVFNAWGAFGASICIATISYRFIERPGIKLGQLLIQSISTGSRRQN